jgi:diketogulonate reductase-like aldo/keto reductase
MYKNQVQIGAAIRAATMPRDRLFLTTKIHCTSPATMHRPMKPCSWSRNQTYNGGIAYEAAARAGVRL